MTMQGAEMFTVMFQSNDASLSADEVAQRVEEVRVHMESDPGFIDTVDTEGARMHLMGLDNEHGSPEWAGGTHV